MNEAAKIINPSLSRIGFFSFFWVSSLKIKFIVLLIVFTGLCVLVSSATAILFILHIQEPKVQAEIPKVKALPTDLVYEIRNLSFSVSDKMLIRNAYVQFVLSIQCRSEECLRQLELNRAKLIDLVYEVSSPFLSRILIPPEECRTLRNFFLRRMWSASARMHRKRSILKTG